MGPGPLGSTSALTRLSEYRPECACLNIRLERLKSTWAWTGSTRHWHGLTQLDIDPGRLGSPQYRPLSSTWPRVDSTRLWPEMTWLDFGPYRLDSTWALTTQLDVDLSRLCSTWVDFSWLNLDRAKSKSNQKCNLDNPKMYPMYI